MGMDTIYVVKLLFFGIEILISDVQGVKIIYLVISDT